VTVSPSVLLLSIAIGVPLMLLALGVLYHAHLLANQQQPSDDLDAHVEQLAVNRDQVLQGLQRSMEQVRGDLTRQRAALRQMMSDAQRESASPMLTPVAAVPAPATEPAPPMVSGAPITPIEMAPSAPMTTELPLDRTSSELRSAVSELAAEGLSDRAIARRLRIGLEEVRLARSSSHQSRRF